MEAPKIINTFNETHLHSTLKKMYALENPGSTTETKVGKYIADILTGDGDIIEIQTGSLSHLLPKIMQFFDEGRKVKVVYPLVATKYIETRHLDFSVTKRKSPTKKNIYSMFRELTALCPILLDKRFALEVLEICMTEQRKETEEKVQSKNGRRRFCKNWIKTGKRLDEILSKKIFSAPKDYIDLLPKDLEKRFVFKDLFGKIRKMEPKAKSTEARLFVWCLNHMGLVETIGKEGRSNLYQLNDDFIG